VPKLPPESPNPGKAEKFFAVGLGGFLGLALLKFGNPAVMNKFVTPPGEPFEWLFLAWPLQYAYPLLGMLGLGVLAVWRRPAAAPMWLLLAPLIWFGWQVLTSSFSIDPQLSRTVITYFASCLACFYLAAFGLRGQSSPYLLLPLLLAFCAALASGFMQHFGGLEETRRYFWAYVYPNQPNLPEEFLRKMQSNRIFGTVFYPNAFAGALLLLSPVLFTWIACARRHFTLGARVALCGLLGTAAVACLYWSGSKGGWLLALTLGAVAGLQMRLPMRLKVVLLLLFLGAGSLGFYWKTKSYLDRGATSVVARFDYWRAATQVATSEPWVGTGPGTFGPAYQAIKKPESEMARLAHNDFLQQASDSGFPGLIAYLVFVGGVVWVGYPRSGWQQCPIRASVWLGFLAWTCQSALEFSLYVPPLGWIAFGFAGWLAGTEEETVRQDPSQPSSFAAP
jgi:O-antigen ligase